MRHIEFPAHRVASDRLGGRYEVIVRSAENFAGKRAKKIKDPGRAPLMLAKRLIIHKKIDHLAVPAYRAHPVGEFLRRKRIFAPTLLAESKRNIVRELVIFKEE